MNLRKTEAGAFTLIELLAIVAIIMLLLSLLVPVLGAARKRAMLVPCANNLRQLYTLCVGYAGDNNNQLPEGLSENPAQLNVRYSSFTNLTKSMSTYGYTPKIWYCPSYTRLSDFHVEEAGGAWASGTWNGSTNWMATGTPGEFPIGYFYVGNPSPGSQWKFHDTPPETLQDIVNTNSGLAWDYCLTGRPCPANAQDVSVWQIFPHYSVTEPSVAQTIMGAGHIRKKKISEMTDNYSYIGAADVYW